MLIRDGKTMTPAEVRTFLTIELARGHEVYPVSAECDNFDYSGGGCRGHEVNENERDI